MLKTKAFVRLAEESEVRSWNELIARFAAHRVTHTSEWTRSLENSTGGKALYLVFEKNGRLAALLPGLIVRVGIFKIFGSSLPGWQTIGMGPVFDPALISSAEIASLIVPFLEKNFGVHHIELMTDALDPEAMRAAGFDGRTEYTYRLPLFPECPEKNLELMKPSARRNIKRAEKLGLTVRLTEEESFVPEIYDQITEVFLRGGNVVPFSESRVAEFFVNMKRGNRLLATAVYLPDGKTCIATGLFTVCSRELLLWMWSHRTAHRWYRPTELMTWTAMKRAMELGSTSFDLMGRGDFKAKFGAVMNGDKTRWIRSRYGWLQTARDLAERLYRFQQSARGRFAARKLPAPEITAN